MEKYNKKNKRFLVAIIVLAMMFQLIVPMIADTIYAEEEGTETETELVVEETAEEPAEEATEEPVEEPVEAPVEEPADDPVEEPTEEVGEPEEPEQPTVVEEEAVIIEEVESVKEENAEKKPPQKGKGSIEFTKVGLGEDEKGLKGAEFGLYNEDQELIDSETSNGSGFVKFKNVPIGKYTIKEISAPEGYELSEEIRYAEIAKSNEKIKLEKFENIKEESEPETRRGSVKLKKLDEEGKPLHSAHFEIYDEDRDYVQTQISDGNGLVQFDGVLLGKYKVKEVEAPTGYELSDRVLDVNLTEEDELLDLGSFENMKEKVEPETRRGSVKLKKLDEKRRPLHSAHFEIYDEDGEFVQRQISDGNGLVQFDEILLGKYTVKEVQAPEAYELSDKILDANLTEENGLLDLGTFKNVKELKPKSGSVQFFKKDNEGRIVTGAHFGIYDTKGKLIQEQISDGNGVVRFDDVVLGEYTVAEISAPRGYLKSDEVMDVQVKKDKKTVYLLDFYNTKIRSTVEFFKKDNEGRVVTGAHFGIYDKRGKLVQEQISDGNGLVRFDDIAVGKYTVREISAPAGYEMSKEVVRLEVKKDKDTITLPDFYNTKIRSTVEFFKKDIEGRPVTGAYFGVFDKKGNLIQTQISDGNGLVRFDDIALGSYKVMETRAPDGYQLSKEFIDFDVENNKDTIKLPDFINIRNKTIVEFTKLDNEGKPLQGAKFGAYTEDGSQVDHATSDENGIVRFYGLPLGVYKFREISAPYGYELSVKSTRLEIKKGKNRYCLPPFINTKTTGSVEFNKRDNEGRPVDGAKFGIYNMDETLIITEESDENGLVRFDDIAIGKYTVKETQAPNGYLKSEDVREVEVKDNEKTVHLLDFYNTKIRSSVDFFKKDNEGRVVTGAHFGIYDEKGKLEQEQISDGNGLVRFDDIPVGKYTVKEISAPAGYLKSEETVNLEVKTNKETIKLPDFYNIKIRSSVEFLKKDIDGNLVTGAHFGIFDNKGKLVQTQISDGNGLVRFDDIALGKYTLRETKAPEGYELSDKEIELEVKSNKETITLDDFINHRNESIVEFKKKDNEGNLLPGARFGIYDEDDALVKEAISGEDGIVRFYDIPVGKYTVKEISAPAGYQTSDRYRRVEIKTETDKVCLPTFTNIKTTNSIEFNKKDTEGRIVVGAKFGLYDKDGKLIQTQDSKENGVVIFNNIAPGKYTIKETEAPEGYLKSEDVKEVEVIESHKTIYPGDFYNTKIRSSVEFFKKDNYGKVVTGAHFGIYDTKGKLVQEQISDGNGLVRFDDIALGKYTVKEISAPAGYEMSDKVRGVEVKTHKDTIELEDFINIKTTNSVEFFKKDNEGRIVAGAKFGIYDKDNKLVEEQISDGKGLVKFDNLALGSYTVKEISAPSGYIKSDRTVDLEVKSDKETVYLLDFYNTKIRSSVEFFKKDNYGRVVTGAHFGIYDKDNKLVQEQISDGNGLVRFDDIALGKYTVKEISAPSGYIKSDKTVDVEVKTDKDTIKLLDFINYRTYKPGPDNPSNPSNPTGPSRPDTSGPGRPGTSVVIIPETKPDETEVLDEDDEIEEIEDEEIPEAAPETELEEDIEEVEETETIVEEIPERAPVRPTSYERPREVKSAYEENPVRPVYQRGRLARTGAVNDIIFYMGGLVLVLVGLFFRKKVV